MLPLASSRGTSNGPDWKDVHQALVNAEHWYGQPITLCIHSAGLHGAKYLVMEARAQAEVGSNGEVLRSVCVNATMSALNVKTLSSAFLNLLLRLDYAMCRVRPDLEEQRS